MTQLQATEELEMFLKGSEYLIANNNGEVYFQNIQALLKKTKESPSFETVQKIDSQKFYKSVMWCDYNVTKYRMKTIFYFFLVFWRRGYQESLHVWSSRGSVWRQGSLFG